MAMYETQEVKDLIPELLRNSLWIALANVKKPSSSHRFELSVLRMDEKVYQYIIHTQRDSTYWKEFRFETESPVDDMTVHIVGFESNWLMLIYS